MGIGTVLGMRNVRVILFKLNEALSSRSDIKVSATEQNSNSKLNALGLEKGAVDLKIVKDEIVLFSIDASDDEGFYCEGDKSKEAYHLLKAAIDTGDYNLALSAAEDLIK